MATCSLDGRGLLFILFCIRSPILLCGLILFILFCIRSLILLCGIIIFLDTLLLLSLQLRPPAVEPIGVPETELLGGEVHTLPGSAKAPGPVPAQAHQAEQLLRVGALLLRRDC